MLSVLLCLEASDVSLRFITHFNSHAGLLHLPLSQCGVSLWHHYCSSKRDSSQHYHKEKGPGWHSGNLSCSASHVRAYLLQPLSEYVIFPCKSLAQVKTNKCTHCYFSLDAKTMFDVRNWERFQFILDCEHQTVSVALQLVNKD